MKRLTFILAATLVSIPGLAQKDHGSMLPATYCYQVQVQNQHDEALIKEMNMMISQTRGSQRDGGLGPAIADSYKHAMVQKTITASGDLISLGINFLGEVAKTQTRTYRFHSWKSLIDQQNTTAQTIPNDATINDFYFLPSQNGPHDLNNLKFDGFSCYYYIETEESRLRRDMDLGDSRGHDVFYVRCSLRRDSLGLAIMANRNKFLLQLDTLIFYPDYCSVPNDGKPRYRGHFDFSKRANLSLDVTARVFSSWIDTNEQIHSDQQIGEFNIVALVDESSLIDVDGNRVFVFFQNDPGKKNAENVSLSGDSFVVPRSSIGNAKDPRWGTGEYRLEVSMTESCTINPRHYLKETAYKNGQIDPAAATKIRNWDKKVWGEELKELTQRDSSETLIRKAWTTIKTAYIGGNWVEEVISPLATALKAEESRALRKWELSDDD